MVRTTVGQALVVAILTIVPADTVTQAVYAADSDGGVAQEGGAVKNATAKRDKPLSGRLPAHYAKVVNQEQRAKIYAIQAEFTPKIAAARDALEALTQERNAQILALLTPEQKKQIEEAAAKSRKKKTGPETESQKTPPMSEPAKRDGSE